MAEWSIVKQHFTVNLREHVLSQRCGRYSLEDQESRNYIHEMLQEATEYPNFLTYSLTSFQFK